MKRELADLARDLADDLEQNDHDVRMEDILDSLASTGLTLVEDTDGVAPEAYHAVMTEERG